MTDQNQTCDISDASWTAFERQLKHFRNIQCKNCSLHQAIEQRMRDSSLGSFLYHLNSAQLQQTCIQQDKLERIIFDIDKGLVNIKKLERFNDICEDLLGLIDRYLRNSPTGKITVENFLKRMNFLRLTGSKITEMDDTLCRIEGLEALVLAGNCLSSCPGSGLPRELMILELCCNSLEDICSLTDNPPPHLMYLGLARNYLTSGGLEPLKKLQFLYHLDLANNNIADLSRVATVFSQLGNLSSLMLIGNPCSMSPNYLKIILEKVPKLIILDGETLKKPGNSSNDVAELEQNDLGALQIYLFRVVGLPQPTNQKINKKKVTHSFRLEIESPLLTPYLPKREESFIIDASLIEDDGEVNKSGKRDVKKKKDSKIKDNTSNAKKTEKANEKSDITKEKKKKLSPDEKNKENKKSSKEVKNKEKNKSTENKEEKEEVNLKEKEDAQMYELALKLDQSSYQDCFKSERKNWGKIIEFNEPAIEVSNCDLWQLRDVFRTDLTLRIVHLKTLPPVSKAKSKPKKQEKNKTSEENTSSGEEINKEILVSKSTVAKIKVPLQDIVWSKKYLEYTWTVTKPLTVELTTDLKNICYAAKKKKEPKNKKGGERKSEVPLPSNLTCHLAIGVKREEPRTDGEAEYI